MRRSEKRKSGKKDDVGARKGRKVTIHCVFPHIIVWGSCFWLCTSVRLLSFLLLPPPFPHTCNSLTHNLLTHNLPTYNSLTHTTYSHTTYSHTTYPHTTHSHNLPTHNLLTHNLLTHNFPTYNSLTHTISPHTTYSHTHNLLTHNSLTHTHNLPTYNSLTHNLLTRKLLTHVRTRGYIVSSAAELVPFASFHGVRQVCRSHTTDVSHAHTNPHLHILDIVTVSVSQLR